MCQFCKLPWYLVAVAQASLHPDMDAAAGTRVGMLRVVNAHDVVPNMPFTLPVPGFL